LTVGCDDSGPTRPPPAPTLTATATPTGTPTPLPCPNLAGSYNLAAASSTLCYPPPMAVPFGTPLVQEQCSIRFFLRLDSGSVFGTVNGDSIDFRWNDACDPDLFGTGTWKQRSDGRYEIAGMVSRLPIGDCCTSISFQLTPR
jgi:hypothetical protein